MRYTATSTQKPRQNLLIFQATTPEIRDFSNNNKAASQCCRKLIFLKFLSFSLKSLKPLFCSVFSVAFVADEHEFSSDILELAANFSGFFVVVVVFEAVQGPALARFYQVALSLLGVNRRHLRLFLVFTPTCIIVGLAALSRNIRLNLPSRSPLYSQSPSLFVLIEFILVTVFTHLPDVACDKPRGSGGGSQ